MKVPIGVDISNFLWVTFQVFTYSIIGGLKKGTFSIMRPPSKCKNPNHTKFSSALISNQGFVNQNTRTAGELPRGCLGRGTKQRRGKINLTSLKNVAWYSTSIQGPKNYPP